MMLPKLKLIIYELFNVMYEGTEEQVVAGGRIEIEGTLKINGKKYTFKHDLGGKIMTKYKLNIDLIEA